MLEIMGNSVFVPLQPSISQNCIAVKRALLKGCKRRSFRICKGIFCSSAEINGMLQSIADGKDILSDHRLYLSGAPDRCLNCVLLADAQAEEGVILHKQRSGYIAASLPIVTLQEAESDYSLALELAILSEKLPNSRFFLHQDLPRGEWNIRDLLRTISLQLDPLSCRFPQM